MAYRFALLLAVALASVCSANAGAFLSGGATSIGNYITKGLIPGFNAGRGTHKKYPTYDAVGSSMGIAGFINGTFAYAFSDDPMSSAQDNASPKKLTIPATLGTYSFVTKKKKAIKLTGRQIALIYVGKITKWSHFKLGAGPIVPVCRSDGSGTTELVTKYLSKAYPAWPVAYVGQPTLLGGPFSPKLVGAAGSSGLAGYVASHPNSLGYVQSGVGVIQFKAYEIGISNPAGGFVFATSADPTQSIPRTLPPYSASWAAVTLVDQGGRATYPIASFVYSFIRRTYVGTNNAASGAIVKSFALYIQGDAAQGLASGYFFFVIPQSIRTKSYRSIKKYVIA